MRQWRILTLLGSAVAALLLAAPALAAQAELPPGRSLEQVSPVDKNGEGAVIPGSANRPGIYENSIDTFAAPTGDRVVYFSYGSFAGAPGGYLNQYLAERTSSGWSSKPLTPRLEIGTGPDLTVGFHGFTCDTCSRVYGLIPWAPDPEDENEAGDIYTTDGNLTWSRESVGELPNTTGAIDPVASRTGGILGFDSTSPLTPSATETEPGNMIGYIRSNGVTTPVAEMPDGHLLNTGGSKIAGPSDWLQNAIGPNGNATYFQSPLSGGIMHVYARLADGSIRQVDASQCLSTCAPQTENALWAGATGDGETAYFVTDAQLLDGHPVEGSTLYSYKFTTGELTAIAGDPEEGVRGASTGFQGGSYDGSTVYFQSNEVLTSKPNSAGVTAEKGKEGITIVNSYVIEYSPAHPEGKITFVGRGGTVEGVSRSGRYALISSAARLSPEYEGGTAQLYLFDASTGMAECISCDGQESKADEAAGTSRAYGPTDSGAVVFRTVQALAPQDTNEVVDVYLHEGGVGGPDYLLSGGKNEFYSEAVGMSEDGTNAYFVTYAQLLPSDTDQYNDLYDARIGSGFPEPSAAGECEGDGCTASVEGAPAPGAVGSSTLVGPPNPTPSQKKKRHHKKKHHKKKHHHKKAKRGKQKQRDSHNRQSNRVGRADG